MIFSEDVDYYAQVIANTNLSTIICDNWGEDCYFNIGTNGKRCPESCSCLINDYQEIFLINCDDQELTSIPELPIPTIDSTILRFQDNALTELPNISSEGYNNVGELYVANNKITSIRLDQLPQNLTSLDIRNNSITTLDPEVVDFLRKQEINLVQTVQIVGDSSLLLNDNRIEALPTSSLRNSSLGELHLKNISLTHLHLDQLPSKLKVLDIRDNKLTGLDDYVTQFISQLTEVQLSGNPWQCECKYTKFLDFLKRKYASEYKVALRNCNAQERCPDECSCCMDDKTLPNASLRHFSLEQLHLKNNSLTHISRHQLPSHLNVLDIRDNQLTGLDDDVTFFISGLREVQLSGNPWQCDCKFITFLDFLKRNHPSEYESALRNCNAQQHCPDHCTCCKDKKGIEFTINCSENTLS
ncbi:phospholipase A2 inhibitor-like [Drosophila tropicalis]|uniref:phospholipase A2 inhibitor-like n=1 Tax=Drosophila tropicalis TaxID=46794 RepID=UPI0035ABEA61